MSEQDRKYFWKDVPGKIHIGRSIDPFGGGPSIRIASTVVDGEEGVAAFRLADEVVLRTTPKERYQIKASFYENERGIAVLTIQKFNSKSGPSYYNYFALVGGEISTLLNFVEVIKRAKIPHKGSLLLDTESTSSKGISVEAAQRLFAENQEIFLQLATQKNLARDVVALGFRRQQLGLFEKFLNDPNYFEAERRSTGLTPEALWQAFFEKNKWIFGFGLSYIFLSGLDNRKLEQVTRGHDLTGSGKRADALMKTQAEINSLCFIEIKRHDTSLLDDRQYRSDTWCPSPELVGGVIQSQVTVQSAIEQIGRKISPTDSDGEPTGEMLFNIAPRSYLIIGSLKQFRTEHGINESKFKSFELYRRHTQKPEIITFDELYYRARFTVENAP